MSDKPNEGDERDQLMLLIKAQADALRDFMAKTDRHLKKVDARLDKHWEAIRQLDSDTSNLSEQLSELDERKQDVPEERELRNAAELAELERQEKEDADKNAELKYLDLQDRLESLEESLDLDGESLAESLQGLAESLEELEKFVRRRLK